MKQLWCHEYGLEFRKQMDGIIELLFAKNLENAFEVVQKTPNLSLPQAALAVKFLSETIGWPLS